MSVSECPNLSTDYFQVNINNSNTVHNLYIGLIFYSADSARNCDEMIEEKNDLKD